MSKHYLKWPVTSAELEALAALATEEERAFFRRNPHLVGAYRDRLLAVALCQGAALQFLGRGYGVNDFDVHFFYARNPAKPRLARTVKRTWASVGAFPNIAVDFVRTIVPRFNGSTRNEPVKAIQDFLRARPTPNASHLAEKAVIGLLPRQLLAATIWPAA